MLAYRHQFHAGNFADVFKHSILVRLLLALARKDKPFAYLDTHAGIGRYDLSHEWSAKNKEYAAGIARVWQRRDAPAGLEPYLELVRAENPDGHLRWYPGSPRVAQLLMRAGDRGVLCELNKTDHAELRRRFSDDRRFGAHLLDGFQAIKAHLPPAERRGLTLMDPSYDRAEEFERVLGALSLAQERFPTGVHAFWYPVMDASSMRRFERRAASRARCETLLAELRVRPAGERLGASGLLVVNPPYRLRLELEPMLAWLAEVLGDNGAGASRLLTL